MKDAQKITNTKYGSNIETKEYKCRLESNLWPIDSRHLFILQLHHHIE